MNTTRFEYRFPILCLLLLFIFGLLALTISTVSAQESRLTQSAITRPQDPLILSGADFPAALLNTPIADLRLYAYSGSAWAPVPFQVDEVTSSGVITATGNDDDDGGAELFDANDLLVVMGADAGDDTDCVDSAGLIGTVHTRYQIAVSDPLNGADAGWFSLYTDNSLMVSPTGYVTWDEVTQTLTGNYGGASHVTTFGGAAATPFLGIDDINANGNGDILDRLKLRVGAICFGGCAVNLNEESIVSSAGIDPNISIPVVGAVRAVSGSGELSVAAYGSRLDIDATLSDLPIAPRYMRVSLDSTALLNNGSYFDSNGNSDTINGAGGIGDTTTADWFQVSRNTIGGMAVNVPSISGGGTTSTYYCEDNGGGTPTCDSAYGYTTASADSGDGDSYADVGLFLDNPSASINFELIAYILPDSVNSNVGATYNNYSSNPLTASTSVSACTVTATTLNSASTTLQTHSALLLILALTMVALSSIILRRR